LISPSTASVEKAVGNPLQKAIKRSKKDTYLELNHLAAWAFNTLEIKQLTRKSARRGELRQNCVEKLGRSREFPQLNRVNPVILDSWILCYTEFTTAV
jgi:hypothetical protein